MENVSEKWTKKTKTKLSKGCTGLMFACEKGDTNFIKEQLTKQPSSILIRDRNNKTALHYCSGQENIRGAYRVIMAAPEFIETVDEDGLTPLHMAVIQGNLNLVNYLLANKANVNALDSEGHSVVHWATVCGEIEILRLVLLAGADVCTPDVNGDSPLHYAAQMCGAQYDQRAQRNSNKLALDILNILLQHPKSSVNVVDKDGRQPLLWAASAGSESAVLALIKASARVESCDKDGLTALHCAASRGHTDCIETLISLCGAPTDLIDANGCTALHYAVTLGHADATYLLLDKGADPNRQDRKGRTPSHCGCAKGQFETVKILWSKKANMWLRNARGDLPVHEAAYSGRKELVQWLLQQRPEQVNTASNDGRSLIHIAATNGHTDMSKVLIDFGADVNSIYRSMRNVVFTPLDCALQKGHRSTAKYLQLHGGLPASKLKLSGRNLTSVNDQELVQPLNFDEASNAKTNDEYIVFVKRGDSTSSLDQAYKDSTHSPRLCLGDGTADIKCVLNGKIQHKEYQNRRMRRRTRTCSEIYIGNVDMCCKVNRSKSNLELRRRPLAATSGPEETTRGSCCKRCFRRNNRKPCVRYKISVRKQKLGLQEHPAEIESTNPKELNEERPQIIMCDKNTQSIDFDNQMREEKRGKGILKPNFGTKRPQSAHVSSSKRTTVLAESKSPFARESSLVESDFPLNKVVSMNEILHNDPLSNSSLFENEVQTNIETNCTNSEAQGDDKDTDGQGDSENKSIEGNRDKQLQQELNLAIESSIAESNDLAVAQNISDEQFKSDTNNLDLGSITRDDEKFGDSHLTNEGGEQEPPTNDKAFASQSDTITDKNETKQESKSSFDKPISFKVLAESEPENYTTDHHNQFESVKPIEDQMNREFNSRRDDDSVEIEMVQKMPETRNLPEKAECSSASMKNSESFKEIPQDNIEVAFRNKCDVFEVLDPQKSKPADIGRVKPGESNACNMEVVRQSIKANMNRYNLERKIFQHLLELKSLQIRSSKAHESVLVKRAVDDYHKSVETLGNHKESSLKRYPHKAYTFKGFEIFLYEMLKEVQKRGSHNFQNVSDVYMQAGRRLHPEYKQFETALQCTTKTHRCLHAAHAYTGIPCAAYIPMMNHHTMPKLGFGPYKSGDRGSFYLPNIWTAPRPRKGDRKVSLELSHGKNKQLIPLPSEKLDRNKRYYVTFSIKNNEYAGGEENGPVIEHSKKLYEPK